MDRDYPVNINPHTDSGLSDSTNQKPGGTKNLRLLISDNDKGSTKASSSSRTLVDLKSGSGEVSSESAIRKQDRNYISLTEQWSKSKLDSLNSTASEILTEEHMTIGKRGEATRERSGRHDQ